MLARNQEAELRRHNPAFGIMEEVVSVVRIAAEAAEHRQHRRAMLIDQGLEGLTILVHAKVIPGSRGRRPRPTGRAFYRVRPPSDSGCSIVREKLRETIAQESFARTNDPARVKLASKENLTSSVNPVRPRLRGCLP
jgi:hypothetical protein